MFNILIVGYLISVWKTREERMIEMAVIKVIEILADSSESWEAATQVAVTEAAKTVKNIQSVFVKNFQAVVDDNNIVKYRVNVKISFIVQG